MPTLTPASLSRRRRSSVCSETRQKVEKQIHIVIPEGTKVLTRPGGRVGVVAHAPSAPEHSYRVRFADGGPEESFRRVDLTIFKHVQDEVPGGPDVTDLYRFVIYRCVVGSTAYGLSQEGTNATSANSGISIVFIRRLPWVMRRPPFGRATLASRQQAQRSRSLLDSQTGC